MTTPTFSPDDHTRVATAIREAEAATSGEIYAVFARQSDGYGFVVAATSLAIALAAALIAALAAPLVSPAGAPVISGLALVIGQGLATLALMLLASAIPALRMRLVPRAIAEQRAHRMALAQFFAHNLQATQERTGILIFVSAAERYAEIVADEGIAAKVPQDGWDTVVADLIAAAREDRLADGYCEAAKAAGAILTAHFPADRRNPNEIPDRLVVL